MATALAGLAALSVAAVCAAPPSSRSADEVLDRRPGQVRVPVPTVCTAGVVLARVGRAVGASTGFERSAVCTGLQRPASSRARRGRERDLTGVSVRQALEWTRRVVPLYAWRLVDGVTVMRPGTAWHAASADVLDAVVGPLNLREAGGASTPARSASSAGVFPGGTVLEALNALARLRGGSWELDPGRRHEVSVRLIVGSHGVSAVIRLAPSRVKRP